MTVRLELINVVDEQLQFMIEGLKNLFTLHIINIVYITPRLLQIRLDNTFTI
jgi:hypothetical protein